MSRRGTRDGGRRAPSAATGDESTVTGPVRTCAGCRARRAAADLVRFAVVEGGGLVADTGRHPVPGRGVWLCASPICAELAARRGGIARALRAEVRVTPETLRERLGGALVERAIQAVRCARRARGIDEADAAMLFAALERGPDGLLDEAALDAGVLLARGRAEEIPPGSGVTSFAWNASILRRFERLREYLDAERGRPETPPGSKRQQRRGDVT